MLRFGLLCLAVISCNADVPMPGGVMEMDTNGTPPGFGKAFKMAKMGLVPIEFEKVTKQIVAGVKYHVKFSAGPLECFSENGYSTENDCENQKRICEFSYVVQSWKKSDVTLASDIDTEICKVVPKPQNNRYDPFSDPELVETEFNTTTDGVIKDRFDQFIIDFDRQYRIDSNDGMYWRRFTVFKKNLKIAKDLQDHDKSAKYGVTKFMDYTSLEYKHFLTGYRPELAVGETQEIDVEIIEDKPASWDWRKHGAVTEVKNQGQCGSCWAFSTTGNVEGQWFLKNGKLVSLSEQELVDCDSTDQGCNGGLMVNAYKSIKKLGGLEGEADYPYDGENEKCKFSKSKVRATVTDSVVLPTDEEKLASWLYKNGPIAIGINAFAMQFYMGGVAHPWKIFCNPSNLDHGVLIVGYGVTDSNKPYWIIKNSWGSSWGEEGYYRIYRGDGSCGLNRQPSSAVVG